MLIDVDNFKKVNDTYGHAFGDECLRAIAHLMRKAFGSSGLCFRTGGDEFTVMVTKRQKEVTTFVEKLEQLVREAQTDEPRLPSVSVGVARAAVGADLQSVINEADERMYDAKRLRKASAA